MAQQAAPLDRETFSCPICGDLLKDQVTLPCGHSYCLSCTKSFSGDDQGKVYSCPRCTQTFIPRLVLEKNTLLAASVEQLNETGNQAAAAAAADPCYAGAGDVSCDVCPDDAASIKLLGPSENPQENICSSHHEVMEMFCRTDQQTICHLCPMDEHKGHDIVSAAAERAEKQKELEVNRQNIQQRIQDREEDVKLLQKEVTAVNQSANKALKDSEKNFTEMIYLIQKRRTEAKQQIRSLQETKVRGVKEIQEKLQQEITELKMKDAELNLLSLTEDHNQFLHSYPSLPQLGEPTSSTEIPSVRHFEDVTAAVSELREKLQEALRDTWANIPPIETKIIHGVSLGEDVQLNTAKNAWKPSRKKSTWNRAEKHSKEAGTQELFKKLCSILNKITAQNFKKLMKQVTELTIDTEERLKGVIDLTFEKAISEPLFSVAYANMCRCLMGLKVQTTDKPGNTVNFRKLLLNRCQKEFEKDKDDDEIFEKKQKDIEAATGEEEKLQLLKKLSDSKDLARRRSLGNIKFLCELFKLKMLTEAIMHDCIVKLLKNHDEESLECLCVLLSTIGKDLDFEKAKPRMDQYFAQMGNIMKERKTSTRIRFMLQDMVDRQWKRLEVRTQRLFELL